MTREALVRRVAPWPKSKAKHSETESRRKQVEHWEAGRRPIPPKLARSVAIALGKPPTFFLQAFAEDLHDAHVQPHEVTQVVVGLRTFALSKTASEWAALRGSRCQGAK